MAKLLLNTGIAGDAFDYAERIGQTKSDNHLLPVKDASVFCVGDQLRPEGSNEIVLVVKVDVPASQIYIQRGYRETTAENIWDDQVLHILGNAAMPNNKHLNKCPKG